MQCQGQNGPVVFFGEVDCYVFKSGENVEYFGLLSTIRVFYEFIKTLRVKDINISGAISDNFRYVVN